METKQTQTNTFTNGLNTDLHSLTTPNTILTDCINGTILTGIGNEPVLQNDLGNLPVENCKLTNGYIPMGMKSYNGIIYIVSYNPVDKKTEIGSYPSTKNSYIKVDEFNKTITYNPPIESTFTQWSNELDNKSNLIEFTTTENTQIDIKLQVSYPFLYSSLYSSDNKIADIWYNNNYIGKNQNINKAQINILSINDFVVNINQAIYQNTSYTIAGKLEITVENSNVNKALFPNHLYVNIVNSDYNINEFIKLSYSEDSNSLRFIGDFKLTRNIENTINQIELICTPIYEYSDTIDGAITTFRLEYDNWEYRSLVEETNVTFLSTTYNYNWKEFIAIPNSDPIVEVTDSSKWNQYQSYIIDGFLQVQVTIDCNISGELTGTLYDLILDPTNNTYIKGSKITSKSEAIVSAKAGLYTLTFYIDVRPNQNYHYDQSSYANFLRDLSDKCKTFYNQNRIMVFEGMVTNNNQLIRKASKLLIFNSRAGAVTAKDLSKVYLNDWLVVYLHSYSGSISTDNEVHDNLIDVSSTSLSEEFKDSNSLNINNPISIAQNSPLVNEPWGVTPNITRKKILSTCLSPTQMISEGLYKWIPSIKDIRLTFTLNWNGQQTHVDLSNIKNGNVYTCLDWDLYTTTEVQAESYEAISILDRKYLYANAFNAPIQVSNPDIVEKTNKLNIYIELLPGNDRKINIKLGTGELLAETTFNSMDDIYEVLSSELKKIDSTQSYTPLFMPIVFNDIYYLGAVIKIQNKYSIGILKVNGKYECNKSEIDNICNQLNRHIYLTSSNSINKYLVIPYTNDEDILDTEGIDQINIADVQAICDVKDIEINGVLSSQITSNQLSNDVDLGNNLIWHYPGQRQAEQYVFNPQYWFNYKPEQSKLDQDQSELIEFSKNYYSPLVKALYTSKNVNTIYWDLDEPLINMALGDKYKTFSNTIDNINLVEYIKYSTEDNCWYLDIKESDSYLEDNEIQYAYQLNLNVNTIDGLDNYLSTEFINTYYNGI